MAAFRNLLQHIFSFAIFSIAFLMAGFPRTTGIFIFILLLIWLTEGDFLLKFKMLLKNRPALFSIALYLGYVAGMIHTFHTDEGINNLVLKISMLVFPLTLFSMRKLKVPEMRLILQFFILGCLLASIILLSVATFDFFSSGASNFTYSYLASPLSLQPAAFSMYLLLCVFALLLPFLTKGKRHVFLYSSVSLALMLFFILMIFMLAARQEMITFLVLLPASLFFYFFSRKRWLPGIAAALTVAGGLLLIIFLLPEARMRLVKMQSQMEEPYSNDSPNSVTMRKVIWQSASEILSAHVLTGVGTGDVNEALRKKYKEKNLVWPLNDNLNAHNQFLQTGMALGISGLLLFIAFFVTAFRVAIIKRSYLYVLFLAIFLLCIITECMLEEEAGVIFFAFFNTLIALKAGEADLEN